MKLLGWLAKSAVSIVLIAGLSLFSAWFVVNMYVEQMMKQFSIPNAGMKIQFTDVLSKLGEEWNLGGKKSGAGAVREPAAQATTAPVSSESGGTPPGSGGSTENGKPAGTEEKVPEDAVAVWGRLHDLDASGMNAGQGSGSAAAGTESGGLGGLVMSQEDFAKKKAAMSSDDKTKLFSLLVNKIPADQLQQLSALIEDGITQEEMKQIDATLQKYLSKDEYKQILDIIQKY